MSNLHNVAATGTFDAPGLHMGTFFLRAGSANASVLVKDGGSGGTTVADVAALANTTESVNLTDGTNGAVFNGQPYLTLSGAGASFSYEAL